MAFVAATPVLWGGQCNPPEPACGRFGAACPPGQISECTGLCVTPGDLDDACSLNPCSTSAPPCAYGLTCVDGTCAREPVARQTFCEEVGAGLYSACPTGTYCRVFDPVLYPRLRGAPSWAHGTCSTTVTEGGTCGADWRAFSSVRVCDAGLRCVLDPRDPSRRACFRGCTEDVPGSLTSLDYACGSDDPDVLDQCVTNVPELVNAPGICAQCLANRVPYTPGDWSCCDPLSTTDSGACCHPEGESCSTDDDCCEGPVEGAPDAICRGAVCQACVPAGERFRKPGCCSGDDPVAGFCPDVCFAGTMRVVEGTSCCESGRWQCDGVRAECAGAPSELPEPDCRDNDCDGAVDEDFRELDGSIPCEAEVSASADFQGCANLGSLGGVINCSTGTPVCAITEGWCAWDRNGNERFNSATGSSGCFTLGEDCAGTACGAGEWCCNFFEGTPRCSREGYIIQQDNPDPVVNSPPPTDCWRPGDLNDNLVCPYQDQPCLGLPCDVCVETSGCGFCDGTCLPGSSMGPGESLSCLGPWLYGSTAGRRCL